MKRVVGRGPGKGQAATARGDSAARDDDPNSGGSKHTNGGIMDSCWACRMLISLNPYLEEKKY